MVFPTKVAAKTATIRRSFGQLRSLLPSRESRQEEEINT